MWNLIRGAVLVVGVVASIASAKPQKAYRTTSRTAPKGVTDADLYAATVRVLSRNGYNIDDKDADAGVVTTELQIVDRMGDTSILHSWRVTISEGEIELDIDCEVRSINGRNACSGDRQRVAEFAALGPPLSSAILAEARRRAAKRQQD
jgi:hypothetical protein